MQKAVHSPYKHHQSHDIDANNSGAPLIDNVMWAANIMINKIFEKLIASRSLTAAAAQSVNIHKRQILQ